MRFLLASESARRVDLLDAAGYDFEVQRSGFEEVTLDDPVQTVRANARGKAQAIARNPGAVVLAADTIVYLASLPPGERILG
ncbi:MAG: Maf family protein, partial [Rubrobacteraceae bacterium]|nr:Maf family protein [Rubrobacteraceae bacterium]